MPSPSKFIANSDLASTPAPLSGAQIITLTTPASQAIVANVPVKVYQEIPLDGEFDTINFIMTCQEVPQIIAYNERLYIFQNGLYLIANATPIGNKVRLSATYTSTLSGTFTGPYTFRAIIVPMKSPYGQS